MPKTRNRTVVPQRGHRSFRDSRAWRETKRIRLVRALPRLVLPAVGQMKVLTVSPRGFCAGVRRAIEIVDMALQKFPAPIYVRKEIVHNKAVVDDFKRRGVVFIDEV